MSGASDKIRARTAVLLVMGAVASIALAVGSYWVQRSITGEKTLSGKVLPDFAADMPQVRTITFTRNRGTYNLVRKGPNWVMPERGDYAVSPQALAGLAKALSDMSYKAERTSDPAQFARLGVDDPGTDSDGVLMSLKGGSNQILGSLYIGKKADATFVRKAGTNQVFEVVGTVPELNSPPFWLDLKVLDITPETIASVSGQRTREPRYDIVRRPDGGFAPLGGSANVTATTAAIALTKWAPLDVMPASQLSRDPIASHATNMRNGMIITATAYREEGRNWVVLSASATSDAPNDEVAKLNQRTDGWAFELNATDFADLTFTANAILTGPNIDAPQ